MNQSFPALFKAVVAAAGMLGLPAVLSAQAPAETPWNDPAAIAVVERGIANRIEAFVDTSLVSYSAEGRGFVYFLLDAPELDRQSLVRTDQVALEVYWRAPSDIRQRIVGLRQREELPVRRLYYYLDRLTVVQDNYGEAIVIADGDNVNDVPHPVVEGATDFYDYRIAGRLTLRLPGLDEPVQIVELEVRPKNPSLPAMAGSVFLAEDSGALVRMSFTFTPAAYVDPRLDYIHVTLENGLWEGRYWLPYEQRLEIRRELPELDLPFGTVIRTRMRISDYEFNQELPEWLFAGQHPITFLPEAQRQNFPFEEPIDAQRRLEGIDRPADVAEIRQEARRAMREQAMSGLPQSRLGIGSVSDVFRFNRAEGLKIGAGLGFRPAGDATLRFHGGWAFAADHPVVDISLDTGGARTRTEVSAYLNRLGDLGPGPAPISGLANTLSSLVLGEDWIDPFYRSGASATLRHDLSATSAIGLRTTLERHRQAATNTRFSFLEQNRDPVPPIQEGDLAGAALIAERRSGGPIGGWTVAAEGAVETLFGDDTRTFGRLSANVGWATTAARRDARLDVTGRFGLLVGDPPTQALYFAGGRGTAPGFGYRYHSGRRFGSVTALATADLAHPWLRGRLSANAGWIRSLPTWRAENLVVPGGEASYFMPSVGVGVGLFYDLLQIDVVRGIGDAGLTQVIVDFQPNFWGFL